jgi:hypothetical protein
MDEGVENVNATVNELVADGTRHVHTKPKNANKRPPIFTEVMRSASITREGRQRNSSLYIHSTNRAAFSNAFFQNVMQRWKVAFSALDELLYSTNLSGKLIFSNFWRTIELPTLCDYNQH